jgi:hypothetical protein
MGLKKRGYRNLGYASPNTQNRCIQLESIGIVLGDSWPGIVPLIHGYTNLTIILGWNSRPNEQPLNEDWIDLGSYLKLVEILFS